MKVWKYYRGEWTEIEEAEIEDLLDWRDGEFLEDALRRSGYASEPLVTYGSDIHSGCAEIYSSTQRGAPPYLITFSFCERVERVYIGDLPRLMQWLRDYALILHLSEELCWTTKR